MKTTLRILVILLVGGMVASSHAQWLNYTYTNYVYSIEYQEGVWWFGTDGGLVRFDENDHSIFVYNRGNSSIISNHVTQLSQDENGNLWIGSPHGISKFDGTTFENFSTRNADLLSDNIKLLEYEQHKGLWVVTDSALTFFDGTSWHHYRKDSEGNELNQITAIHTISYYGILFAVGHKVEYLNHDGVFEDKNFVSSGYYRITGLGFDWQNNLIVATDNGFYVNNGSSWTYYGSSSPLRSTSILQMRYTSGGDVYFVHSQHGFSIWHSRTNTWSTFPAQDGTTLSYLHAVGVNRTGDRIALAVDVDLEFSGGVIFAERPNSWSYTFSDVYDLNVSPLHSNQVQNIVIKDSWKYISTRGIDVLDANNRLVRSYDLHDDPTGSLILANFTKSLAVDAWGNIWCSDNVNNGLLKISGDQIHWINSDSIGVTRAVVDDAIQWETLIRPDGNISGRLWTCMDGRLIYYDYDDSTWHSFPYQPPDYPSVFYGFAMDVAGVRWFAANGVYSYDGENFLRYFWEVSLKQPTCVARDSSGNIWFGGVPYPDRGWQGGLARYDGNGWTYLTAQNSDLPDDYVTSLACDTLGNLWIGTQHGGLARLDTNGVIEVFNRTNSPLDNDWIVNVAVDRRTNDIWILNSESGVFVYNEKGLTGVEQRNRRSSVPGSFALEQNYPNPFNPTTTIRFSIAHQAHVTLKVFDLLGQEVATLVDEKLSPGEHRVAFQAGNLPSGVYVYRLQAGDKYQQRKMVLVK